MTPERARSYAHVLQLVDELGSPKLTDVEQAAVRDAADALLFSREAELDAEARDALHHLEDVMERLVAVERLLPATGEALLEAVEACGPPRVVA